MTWVELGRSSLSERDGRNVDNRQTTLHHTVVKGESNFSCLFFFPVRTLNYEETEEVQVFPILGSDFIDTTAVSLTITKSKHTGTPQNKTG